MSDRHEPVPASDIIFFCLRDTLVQHWNVVQHWNGGMYAGRSRQGTG